MHYNYEKIGVDASYKKYTNKLRWVDETVTTAGINDDIEDQTKDNYEYDDIGNLTFDRKEEIDKITWTVYGKVKEVKRCSTSTKYDLEFLYDATGKRIAKIKKPAATKADATTWTTTWYMHDASGNVMATYEYKNPLSTDKFCLKEQMIYGSSRLGICQVDLNLLTAGTTLSPLSERILGNKYYEQSNHLGNVLTVVSDKKIPYDAEGQNLVVNGTFESSTAGLGTNWIWPNSSYIGTPSIVSGNGFTSSAQRVDIPTGKTRIILRNLITTTPGKQYKLTFKHRSSNGFNVNGNAALSWYQNIAANTGSAQTVSYVVTTNANSLGVEFDMNKSAGDWLEIDDISLTLLDPDAAIDFYQASVISTSDYYAFGSPIYDRTHYASEYKYGFNGMEKNDELNGTYTTDYRQYDSRLARWFSIDPKIKPNESPYAWVTNNPILYADPTGADSTQRANAVTKANDYVAKNTKPGKDKYSMGAKGNEPGKGAIDCSGLVSKVVKAGGEPDPNKGTQTSGVLNIQENTLPINQADLKPGYIVTFYKTKGYANHTGIITEVSYDDDGVPTITVAHSQSGTGPTSTTFSPGDGSKLDKMLYGFYKWDTKPDYDVSIMSVSDKGRVHSLVSSIHTSALLASVNSIQYDVNEETGAVTQKINQLDQYWLGKQHEAITQLNAILGKYGQEY